MKRILIMLILLVMAAVLTGCGEYSQTSFDFDSIQSYQDIPGVTEEEIAAIEAIKATGKRFTYGHLTETEAFILPDGTYSGFTTKFCELLSSLFDIKFNQEFCEWDDLKNKLDSRLIDFTGDLTSTPERMKTYYMTHAIADRSFRIFMNIDAQDISFESDINGLKVGFLAGSIDAESIAKSYPSLVYKIVNCAGFADAARKLEAHEIDVFVTEGIVDPAFDEYDFIRSKEFFPLAFTPVSLTTANPELAPIISVVNKYLVAGGIDKLFELYQEGDDEYAIYKLSKSFTDEERAYIDDLSANGGKVSVALEHDNYPISFYNKSEKEFQGISIDVLKEIGRLTGIEFETATDENTKWAEILEKLHTGEITMASQLLYSDARKNDFIWTDVPYCSAYYALLSKSDYPDLSSYQVLRANVGTIKKSAHEDKYNEWFANNSNTLGYDTQNEALDALEKGEIDLLMGSEYMLLTQTNYREKPGYKVNILFNTPMDSLFGFHKDEEILCSIINKAQLYIKTDAIANGWTSRVFDFSKKLATERSNYLMIFVCVLVLVVVLTMVLLIKNKRLSKNLEETVKKRTLELERQTSTLSTIYTSIPDLVFCKDTSGVYTSCNPSFEKFAGVPMAELVGKTDKEIFGIDEQMAAQFMQDDQEMLRKHETIVIEEVITYPDGTQFTVETTKTPLLSPAGDYEGLLGISRDVTHRKKTEETLTRTLDNLDTCIYINEIESGKILFINKKMVAEFGGGELNGKVCWEVLQDGFEEQCGFCPMPKLLDSGDEYHVWEEHNTVTGKYYKNTDSLIEWQDGRLVHMQHSMDITDVKQAEAALKRRLAQQELMSSISQSFITDNDMDMFINKALQMTGEFMDVSRIELAKHIEAESVLEFKYAWSNRNIFTAVKPGSKLPFVAGTPMYDVFLVNKRPVVAINDVEGNDVFQHIKLLGIKAFLVIPVFVSGKLWGLLEFDQCGHAYTWSESDIYLAKLIGNVLSGVINRQIMEEDKKAAEERILKAKEIAERASKAKSDFLSRMSHEMRTPLNAVIGMTSIAKSSNDIERKDYCLEKIDSASTHLLGVINDVLDMSKIEAGKFELSYTDFNLERMLIRITNVVNFRMEEKKQRFVVKVDRDVPQAIVSDEQRLNQVITNLLGNAIKFTPDNGTISLFVRNLAEENGIYNLEFEVKDTGIGISEEQQNRLFTSFEQADGSISRKYGGTGLGLAISKRIVEMMDGQIWVQSEVGQGSSFVFNIRTTRGNCVQNLINSDVHWSDLRVLVVDDSEDVREFFLSLSEPLKLRCEVAASGEEACEMMERLGPFNVIFADWKMPGMDGMELTRRIKSQYDENTVVIMISAFEWSQVETEAKQAGVDGFISKPLFASAIADCINECLGLRVDKAAPGSVDPDTKGCFEGRRILLAEDVEINREIVIALLESTGIRIDCAEDGRKAYRMFKDNPAYDMIFMDIHMPEVDGYESTAMIRAIPDPRAQAVPIIAMTANVFREDIEKCLTAGMNGHVGKPLDIEDVMATLKRYLLAKK